MEGGLCVGSSDNLHVERKSPLLGEGAEAYQGSPPRPPGMWTPLPSLLPLLSDKRLEEKVRAWGRMLLLVIP